MIEIFGLEPKTRWDYLGRFYREATEFYRAGSSVLGEDEIAALIARFKEKPAPSIRKAVRLREWAFTPDLEDEGLARAHYSFDCDASQWQTVMAPHSFNHVPPDPVKLDNDTYVGKYRTWYRTRVQIEALRQDEVAYLDFQSVNLLCDVWVNEEAVMTGHLGPHPFRIGVTDQVGKGPADEALVAVRVTYIATNQPWFFSNGLQVAYANQGPGGGTDKEDWRGVGWSGIAGEATLLILNETHVEDAFFFTRDIVAGQADLVGRLTVRNTSRERFTGRVRIEVSRWLPEEGAILKAVEGDVTVLPTNEVVLDVPFTLAEPDLWSPESPNLYLARVILEAEDGRALDDYVDTFGVRTIKMVGPHFHLNGRKVVPRGTHDLTHYFGDSMICPSDHSIARDLFLHKKLGATCSRWPSDTRMHYERIADYCDQFGFMLSWCGFFEMWRVHPEMELYAQRDARAVVRSLRNHPSIVFWEMGDEPLMGGDNFRRMRWYEQIYGLVSGEDRSRPIIPAGWYCDDDLVEQIMKEEAGELDVEERRKRVLRDNPIFTRELAAWDYHYCPAAGPLRQPLHEHIDRVAKALGGVKPTVLTEFGLDALPDFDKVREAYGLFPWASTGIMSIDRAAIDESYFGRRIGQEDWRETQACQALFHGTIIDRIRESPEAFAAFYLVTMFDVWSFYWGLVDILGNPKLSYFVAQALYAPVCVSALHGNVVARDGDCVEVKASNFGPRQEDASLRVRIKDGAGVAVREEEFGPLTIEGDGGVTTLGTLELSGLAPDLYSIESSVKRCGEELARRLEMFYFEPQP
ncbi:MAG: hypothetical protein KAX44_04810 [Candidatus Brocadiae bacterium]|nr:hypothetical protein [Candidatus Brocadiia bacterium]